MPDFSLAELMIVAAAEAWREDDELLAAGIGTLPRIAAGLAKLTMNGKLMITDGESVVTEDPVPIGAPEGRRPPPSGWLPYARAFDCVWSGRRHAMVTPVQVDRWAQTNISALGDFRRPKVQMLGCRGFPGNSISHRNSFLVTSHTARTFVAGEVDVVCSLGFSGKRFPDGATPVRPRIGLVITPLCVMDFEASDNAARIRSLHPGVSLEEVCANTGFPLQCAPDLGETPRPTPVQLEIIARLDPDGARNKVLKGNPAGDRKKAA